MTLYEPIDNVLLVVPLGQIDADRAFQRSQVPGNIAATVASRSPYHLSDRPGALRIQPVIASPYDAHSFRTHPIHVLLDCSAGKHRCRGIGTLLKPSTTTTAASSRTIRNKPEMSTSGENRAWLSSPALPFAELRCPVLARQNGSPTGTKAPSTTSGSSRTGPATECSAVSGAPMPALSGTGTIWVNWLTSDSRCSGVSVRHQLKGNYPPCCCIGSCRYPPWPPGQRASYQT